MRNVHGASPISYILVDGGKYVRFLEAFPETDMDNSSAVLVAYRGPVTLEGFEEFVSGVLGGDISFKSIAQKPTL
jgi:hypothetical protein